LTDFFLLLTSIFHEVRDCLVLKVASKIKTITKQNKICLDFDDVVATSGRANGGDNVGLTDNVDDGRATFFAVL
jgi:hypothetical protein